MIMCINLNLVIDHSLYTLFIQSELSIEQHCGISVIELLKIQSRSVQGVGVGVQAECISLFLHLSLYIMALTIKSTVKREEKNRVDLDVNVLTRLWVVGICPLDERGMWPGWRRHMGMTEAGPRHPASAACSHG